MSLSYSIYFEWQKGSAGFEGFWRLWCVCFPALCYTIFPSRNLVELRRTAELRSALHCECEMKPLQRGRLLRCRLTSSYRTSNRGTAKCFVHPSVIRSEAMSGKIHRLLNFGAVCSTGASGEVHGDNLLGDGVEFGEFCGNKSLIKPMRG